jgi:hypothetical protein
MPSSKVYSEKKFRHTAAVADDGTVTLPTITTDFPAIGLVEVATGGAIVESAEWNMSSDGTVNLIRSTANIVANADTDTKFCLGTAGGQNPLVIKNRLGGSRNVMISFLYG